MNTALTYSLTISLPDWLAAKLATEETLLKSAEERMRFTVDLARDNVRHGTGGPFAAAVFEHDTGRLVAAGVNVVVTACCSSAHAEVMALSLAQQALSRHDLGSGKKRRQLVTSAEPCAMCMGAIPWSGVSSVICGARDEDVRAVGFDEGNKPADWVADYRARGIDVCRDILRGEAAAVLRDYQARGGEVY